MTDLEKLREQIAKWLQKNTDFAGNLDWEDFDLDSQEGFRSRADKLLSIDPFPKLLELLDQTRDDCPVIHTEGDNFCSRCGLTGKVGDWHPERLVVLDKDQDYVPDPRWATNSISIFTQQDMLKAGFRKVIQLNKDQSLPANPAKGVEMTDNEAREKQIQTLAEEIAKESMAGNVSSKSLAVWLYKDGYRKIPEQLEVLTDDEIISAISSICDELDLALANNAWHKLAFGAIVLAQLDKDNRKLGVK